MYMPHYPQRICLTSIYSYDEYNIFNIMLFVMSNNTRRMRVCQGISYLRFSPQYFLGIFLEKRICYQESLCLHCGIPC
jgi:hypothetical protein